MKKCFSKKGQATVEAILIMVVLVGLVMMLINFQETNVKEWMSQVFNTPRNYLKGMVRSGVWMEYGTDITYHPNTHFRHIMSEGQDATN